MNKLVEIGLSGWIIFIISCLFGGGFIVRQIIKRRSRQSNITAGGDVAGGDIIKGTKKCQDDHSVQKIKHSIQKNITAGGDVAGGDITKSDK